MRCIYLYFLLIAVICTVSCNRPVNSYVPYEGVEQSDAFHVFVNDQEAFVGKEYCFGDSIFHTCQFFVEGKTKILIQSSMDIEQYEIRPRHLELKESVNGNKLEFTIEKPQMLMVEINDFKPLCLFQTPPVTRVPDSPDNNVLYFTRGIHEAGLITPHSNQTIYLEQGAIVKGRILAENVENVVISGRGILDARGFTSKAEKICGLEFRNSKNITVDGIGLRTGEWWQSLYLLCEDVTVKNMNLMSFGLNNDGIDIDGVSNIHVSNCFIGCGDDGFGWHAVDAEKNGEPPTRNCLAENCVIYNAHAGNGLRVGASMETSLFENITFRNITVFCHANAGIRSDHSDWALVKNLRFEDFYIEQEGRPVEIRIEKTIYSNNTGFRDERGHIKGMVFKNLHASGGEIILEGYDENHLIEDVAFINSFNKNGKILGPDDIQVNEYVRDLSFK
jgi:hypothetical protein